MAEIKKGLYRHFKGGKYVVREVARHSENHQEEFVVYESVEKGTTWIRPLSMFLDQVEKPELNYSGPRFEYLSPGENLADRKTKRVGTGFGVLIKKGTMVLLGRRHSDPDKADSALHGEGTWVIPGGKLHFGEKFGEAAKREVFEETGIKLKKAKIICVQNDMAGGDAHFMTVGFLATEWKGEPKVMEPDEIVEWRWFPIKKLPRPMFKPSEKVIKNFLNKTFCSDI